MQEKGTRRKLVAGVLTGVLLGSGLATVAVVTPAEAGSALATNWNKVWKQKLRKKTDRRYYTKKQANRRFSTESETADAIGSALGTALMGVYTKAQVDEALTDYYTKTQTDQALAGHYTKAEADARYAPYPALIRGTYNATGDVTAANRPASDNITFGVTLSAAPTPHYVNRGAAVPAECAGGTAANPNAAPGHLCVFEAQDVNVGTRSVANSTGFGGTSAFGANIFAYSSAAGQIFVYGSWAVRPLALAGPEAAGSPVVQRGARAGD